MSKELTLKELGEYLKTEQASIHISSRQRARGRAFCVVLVREVEHASTDVYNDDLERAVKIALADL